MKPEAFHLERYMSLYEFSARHSLASSDCESYPLAEVVAWADDECRGLWEDLRLGYTESQGLPQLRREIASTYDGVSTDDVLEVVPEEGVLIAMTVLLEPGDHVIVTHPGYQTLYGIAEGLGCDVTYWQPDEEQGWRFDPAFVRRALRPATRLIVANFPHNPTGYLPTGAEYQELLDIAAEAGAYLFSDEMYRGLEQEPATRLPSAVERYGKAVTLSGMSKTYSMPGLRVGWLATRDRELYARLAAYKDYTTICAGAPSEILALIGLREQERIIARNLGIISGNLDRLEAFGAERPGLLSLIRPRAGSICFARLGAAEGALAFCRRLVEEAGALLLPSTVFGYGDAHVRFGLGRTDFGEGLKVFGEWLEGRVG
jgi:aspartate/methionine/tyrosine aminotransferase